MFVASRVWKSGFGTGIGLKASLDIQVAPNKRPLCPEVAQKSSNVAQNHRLLALGCCIGGSGFCQGAFCPRFPPPKTDLS